MVRGGEMRKRIGELSSAVVCVTAGVLCVTDRGPVCD